MSDDDDNRSVVVATTNVEKILYIIAKEGMYFDTLDLHFTEKYAPTVEYLLRILRKSFGWMEIDRGKKESFNTKCVFAEKGLCTHAKNLEERGLTKGPSLRCTEEIRTNCKHYEKKYPRPLKIQYVTVEKAGGIRNM